MLVLYQQRAINMSGFGHSTGMNVEHDTVKYS
jgi:hypothetical protein